MIRTKGFHQIVDFEKRLSYIKTLEDHKLLTLLFEVQDENPELGKDLMLLYNKMSALYHSKVISLLKEQYADNSGNF